MGIDKNDPISNQLHRYSIFLNQVGQANKEKKDIIIYTDHNINISDECNTTSNNKNLPLKVKLQEMVTANSLTIHNQKPTSIRGPIKSCIDYILSYWQLTI